MLKNRGSVKLQKRKDAEEKCERWCLKNAIRCGRMKNGKPLPIFAPKFAFLKLSQTSFRFTIYQSPILGLPLRSPIQIFSNINVY
jgi:hypothetical protein